MSPVAAACASGASGEGEAAVVTGAAAVVGDGASVVVGVETGRFDPPHAGRNAAMITKGSANLTTGAIVPSAR
jgi:hypothetical protein